MAPTKTLEQWRRELDSLGYEVRVCRQELDSAYATNEDPFTVYELETAWRGASARLADKHKRYRASLTVKARNRARKA